MESVVKLIRNLVVMRASAVAETVLVESAVKLMRNLAVMRANVVADIVTQAFVPPVLI